MVARVRTSGSQLPCRTGDSGKSETGHRELREGLRGAERRQLPRSSTVLRQARIRGDACASAPATGLRIRTSKSLRPRKFRIDANWNQTVVAAFGNTPYLPP